MVPLIFAFILINLTTCSAIQLNTLVPASSTMLNQVNSTAADASMVNQTIQVKQNSSLVTDFSEDATKLEDDLPDLAESIEDEEPLVVSAQQMTNYKIKAAQSKQPNQDKLYAETLKEEMDEELDEFPVVLETDILNNETVSAEAIIQRGKNEQLLEDIIVRDEIEEVKQEKNETEVMAMTRAKEEAPLSISEIIQRRFKNQIQVNEATTPQEVEDMIIEPGFEANTDMDNNSWLVSFLDERRYPKMNGTISKLYQHLHKRMPTMDELRKTSNQIADNLKSKLVKAGNMILAQTSSEPIDEKGGLSDPNKMDRDSRRNVTLLVCVVVQTVICCTLSKVLLVPLAQESAYELNFRTEQRVRGKTFIMRDPVVVQLYDDIIQEAKQQKKLEKAKSRKERLKRSDSQSQYTSGVTGFASGAEQASGQSGGGSQVDVGSRASKADIEQGEVKQGVGSRVSSKAKAKRKARKENPHLRPSAK